MLNNIFEKDIFQKTNKGIVDLNKTFSTFNNHKNSVKLTTIETQKSSTNGRAAIERLLPMDPKDNAQLNEQWVLPKGRLKFAYSTLCGKLVGGRIKTNQDNLVIGNNVI